ncbi:MAG: hypothetical protein JRF64_06395 [Deltaproteobacteria bacterium]|nr:hypothetical protein [Deltaproteobacteria bacterium]
MKDPIVEEVHRARRELWDECGGDLQKLVEKLKSIENEEKHRVVSLDRFKELKKAKPSPTRT